MRAPPWSSAGTWSGDELLDPRLSVICECEWFEYSVHKVGIFMDLFLKLSYKCPSYPCLAPAHRTWTLSVSSRVGIPNRTPFPDLRHVPLSGHMPSIITGFPGEGWGSGSRLIWWWCPSVDDTGSAIQSVRRLFFWLLQCQQPCYGWLWLWQPWLRVSGLRVMLQ